VVVSLVHLKSRDRHALWFRVAGAVIGAAVFVAAFATSGWESPSVIATFILVTVGGAIAYYLLTSIVRCPSCGVRLTNFRIESDDEKRKTFACGRCGSVAFLCEGFYWQSDVAG